MKKSEGTKSVNKTEQDKLKNKVQSIDSKINGSLLKGKKPY